MSALSQFLAYCFKITLFQVFQMTWHCSQHVHNIQTSLEILPDKLIHIYFLPLVTHKWGQSPWLVSSFYPTLKFIQHVSSTMCDVSTSKIKQTRQHSTCTTKNFFPPNLPLLTKLLWLLFPTNPSSGSIPTSVFCFPIRNLLYQLSDILKKSLISLCKCLLFLI